MDTAIRRAVRGAIRQAWNGAPSPDCMLTLHGTLVDRVLLQPGPQDAAETLAMLLRVFGSTPPMLQTGAARADGPPTAATPASLLLRAGSTTSECSFLILNARAVSALPRRRS